MIQNQDEKCLCHQRRHPLYTGHDKSCKRTNSLVWAHVLCVCTLDNAVAEWVIRDDPQPTSLVQTLKPSTGVWSAASKTGSFEESLLLGLIGIESSSQDAALKTCLDCRFRCFKYLRWPTGPLQELKAKEMTDASTWHR